MRVGTDAVILGSWANVASSKKILDAGTGSGVIALMLAQRNHEAHITGIDIHPDSVLEATENFKMSSWNDRLTARLISFQELAQEENGSFDHIVSNPPFFSGSLASPDSARQNARHTDELPMEDFFASCKKSLISKEGRISLIFPYTSASQLKMVAEGNGFFPSRSCNLFPYPGKPAERILLEFSQTRESMSENREFFIRTGKNREFSEEYKSLTFDFYSRELK